MPTNVNWKHYTGLGALAVLALAGLLSLFSQAVVWAGMPRQTEQNRQDNAALRSRVEKLESYWAELPPINTKLDLLSKQVADLHNDLKEHERQTMVNRP